MIKITDLDFFYGKTKVFKNISLDFEKGNIYGLLGENGVGKTTLLKIICGLQRPDYGTCTVDEHTPSDRKPDFLENIFFLPEVVITPDTTPEKFAERIGAFYHKFDIDFFNQLAAEMEIDPKRKFATLSYGQQKKAFIAMAISLRTDYLLLDEPTNGLDIPSKALFRQIIARHCTDDTTIIISTHQVKDVENLIDPIVILDHDDILLKAGINEIADKLHFAYGTEKADDALYTEMLPGGFLNVTLNTEGVESQVNIEGLFNAVMKNKKAIKELFN